MHTNLPSPDRSLDPQLKTTSSPPSALLRKQPSRFLDGTSDMHALQRALDQRESPCLRFSYSCSEGLLGLQQESLQFTQLNGGVVMVSFYNYFLTCNETATVHDVVRHINHIRDVAGLDHVGLGADFDGINKTPVGLEDVSKYPLLLAEVLKDSRWSEEDVAKLAGGNLLRVLRRAEQVRDELSSTQPYEDHIHPDNLAGRQACWWT
ncbi:dipeptidase 2-like [Penaeus monodon]|uniref:dipeptidase 2-like n=1 Tax=Penaeus monodon TaxID=6687 RepID=UPI0018A75B83|nr:dipeptidase 2-like [Penaeus monodon]